MPYRVQLGNRAGAYGIWVSKPGVDVTAAGPGQFLLSTAVGPQQIMAYGNVRLISGPPIFTGGTFYVPLPAACAGLSDLMVSGFTYLVDDYLGGQVRWTQWQGQKGYAGDSTFKVVDGYLIVQLNNEVGLGGSGTPQSVWARYAVFRGRVA